MKKLRLRLLLLLVLPVFALVGSGSAIAEDAEASEPVSDTIEHIIAEGEAVRFGQKSVSVSFADLNIKNEQGAKVLYRRLQRASESVCDVRDARNTRCLEDLRAADECYNKTLDAAVESIDSDALMSLHYDKEPAEMYAAKAQ